MNKRNKKNENRGIALLFSIMLSAIFLSIVVGVLDIATKELTFSSSGRDTNNAFFAADSGIECALYNDKSSINSFVGTSEANFMCFGESINLINNFPDFNFVIPLMGSDNQSCAKISIVKELDPNDPTIVLSTKIISKGYNVGDIDCNSTNLNRVERVIEVNY